MDDVKRIKDLEALLDEAEHALRRIRDLTPPYAHNRTPYDLAACALGDLHDAWQALTPAAHACEGDT